MGGPQGAASFSRDQSRLARCVPAPLYQMLLRRLPRTLLPDALLESFGADQNFRMRLVSFILAYIK